MWLFMNVGQKPFSVDEKGQLSLKFSPALAGWLFTETESQIKFRDQFTGQMEDVVIPAQSYAFSLFGATLVIYHNPSRKNTFGKDAVRMDRMELIYRDQNKLVKISGDTIVGLPAHDVRDRKVKRIDAYFV